MNYLRPYRGYADINFRSFDASSNYNALQVSVEPAFCERLAFGLAYTWSRTQTTSNAGNEYAHPFNTRAFDYKVADFDRTHMLVVNYVYDVPGLARYVGDNWLARGIFDNWQISGISQFVTGTPLEVGLAIAGVDAGQRLVGAYTAGNLSAQQPRPLARGDAANRADDLEIESERVWSAAGWICRAVRPHISSQSELEQSRHLASSRTFRLGGDSSRYLQLRFEFFNVFNHAQFSGINTTTNLAVPNGTNAAGIRHSSQERIFSSTMRRARRATIRA